MPGAISLFQRAPDGEELVFDEEVIERIREGGEVEIRRTTRRDRRIHDELPIVAEKYKEFRATGEVNNEDKSDTLAHGLKKMGCRLDCGPYMTGAVEARMLIKKRSMPP